MGIHKLYQWLYNDATPTALQMPYLVTVDVDVRNIKKVRFSPVKIKVIRRIVNHIFSTPGEKTKYLFYKGVKFCDAQDVKVLFKFDLSIV